MRTLSLVLLALMAVPAAAQTPEPPVARVAPVELERHGHVRSDPYYWLRERDDPAVTAYLEAENAYFDAQMAPLAGLRERLFEELRAREQEDDASVPVRLGDFYYYSRKEPGKQYPIYARRRGSMDAPEQVIVDVNAEAAGHEYFSARVAPRLVSPDGRTLAWAADTTGRRRYTVRFRDLETGRDLPDVLDSTTGNLVWANDSRTVFYTRQDPETLRWDRVFRHALGASPDADPVVYREDDDTFYTFVTKTRDDRFVLIGSDQTLATEYRFLDADTPEGAWAVVQPRERGHEYHVEHHGGHFYIRTNRGAPDFRLVRAPVATPGEARWAEVVPARDGVYLQDVDAFRDHLVLTERAGGLTRLRVLPGADPAAAHAVAFDDPAYAVSLGDNPTFDTATLRFVYESPTTPETTYDYDMATRERTLLKREPVLGGFDPADYRAERLEAPARDGTGVPVTLVYRRDRFRQDGSAPLLLYGYGSYGSSIDPFFHRDALSLLDRGFAFAVAHVRGGQELGRAWYEGGKLLQKQNTFTDFIDAADFLAGEGYGDPARLYAMGGSAGGLLVGAVANMRPELFHGIVAHVPFVDVVTTMLDDSIPLTTNEYDEWGNPNEEPYYRYMLAYSPYDNVEPKGYPHLLVTTGLEDSQVQYWEPAKWVAKLRATKTDQNLLLLHTNMGAGHGGASGRYERYRERARDWAFLLHLAGLEGG